MTAGAPYDDKLPVRSPYVEDGRDGPWVSG